MRRTLVIVGIALLATATVASAGFPPQPTYTMDPCVVTCPAGDSVFFVRNIAYFGKPVPGADFAMDFSNCPGFVIPPAPPGSGYTSHPTHVTTFTDATATASVPLSSGGTCGAGTRIYVSGNLLATRPVASFDQNGDLFVDDADLSLIDAKVGTLDKTADFDCDGAVTAADRQIAGTHRGHAHWQTVGVGDLPPLAFAVRVAPNPATGPVEFELRAPRSGRAVLAIHDVSGRRIATVLDREVEPGVQRAAWSGRDASGHRLPAGLYLYRARVGTSEARGALILAR